MKMRKQVTHIAGTIFFIVLILFAGYEYSEACNVAVVTASASATGRPFIWKNRDNASSYRQEVLYRPEVVSGVGGSVRIMGETSFDGVAVCSGGANASGFAIANTTCIEADYPTRELDNVNTELMEMALERCKTLEDFEALCAQFTSIWSSKNISGIFGVIDGQGGAAIYEMWTNGNGRDIMYRKYDAVSGAVTDEDGAPFTNYDTTPTVGFANRTNSNHAIGWIDIESDDPRECRARDLLTEMLAGDTLSPRNMMRLVAKDVCGGDRSSYCISDYVEEHWDTPGDNYISSNFDGEMHVSFCISRHQTTMGMVVEGVGPSDDPALTTVWIAPGEPSLSVFTPYFPAAGEVSRYAFHNEHTNSGYYWDGVSTSGDTEDNSFLNLLYDCVEANPFSSGHELYDTYAAISLYTNNGSGPYVDTYDRNNGGFYMNIYGTNFYYMDNTINYPRLLAVQAWSQPLEDYINDRAADFVEYITQNPAAMTAENLAEFSHYCNYYVFENYSHQSSSYQLWDYELPPDGVPPEVVLDAESPFPASGSTGIGINSPVSARFNEAMDGNSVNTDTFTLYVGTRKVEGTVGYDPDTRTATFTPSEVLNYSTYHRATITGSVTDQTGTPMAADYTWNFTTMEDPGYGDGNPPLVSPLTPPAGAANVLTDVVIAMQFSEAMDESTMVPDNIRLYRGTTRIYGSVSYHSEDHSLSFDPYSDLAVNKTYTVCVYTGAADISGLGLAEDVTWTFTTGEYSSAGDGAAPQVSSVTPEAGDTGVYLNSAITIQFSEVLDPDTDFEEKILVSDGDGDVDGEVSYNQSTSTVVFRPLANLTADMDHTVTVAKDIKDLSGLEMDDSVSWGFRTGATTTAGDGTAPQIESVTPAMGAKSVSTSIAVAIQFSEAMDVDTIDETTILLTGPSSIDYSVEYNEESYFARVIPGSNLEENQSYAVTVLNSVKDESGLGLADDVTWTFKTGSSASGGDDPELVYVNPMPDSEDVNPAETIAVQFDDDMDEDTIDNNSFCLYKGTTYTGLTPVSGIVSYVESNRSAILTPDDPLDYDTEYTVSIADTVGNTQGRTLGDEYTWSFATGSASTTASTAPPQVASVGPGPGSTGVNPKAVIRVQFNKSMDELSLTTDSVTLYAGAIPVAGQVVYSPTTMTATFRPGGSLASSTVYTVHISRDVYDIWGYSMDDEYTWSFSTSAKTDSTEEGCMSTANASTYKGGRSGKYPGLINLLITMLFPFSLMRLHRRLRRKKC